MIEEVTKEIFDSFIIENTTMFYRENPFIHITGYFKYEIFHDPMMNEIAYISYTQGKARYYVDQSKDYPPHSS